MFKKDVLIRILSQGQATFPKLARKLGIPRDKNREFSKQLFTLVKKGEIFQTQDRQYYLPEFVDEIVGSIRLNPRGFGFVEQEDKDSIFIAGPNTNTAMNNDEVRIKVFPDPEKDDKLQGVVVEVLKRSRETFVARTKMFGDKLGLSPLDSRIKGKFRFVNVKNLKPDYEVKVKILNYGENYVSVDVVKVLGHKDDVSMDIMSVIEDADVPYVFAHDTLDAAKKVPDKIDGESFEGRRDVRDRLIVTIDGDDTKDFDDAIGVTKLENGNYLLEVHIADVTHYVHEGMPLDNEAKLRGTSIYLADRVIPMLPKALSNGICSLNPNVDRFVLSAEMEIDSKGNTVRHELYPGIINSKHRLTYKEVNNYYKGAKTFDDPKLAPMLDVALELSNVIREYKIEEGYIDFEIEEAKIIIDNKGKTSDIVVRERSFSEMMIEDFMVRANETVAEHASDNKVPFIYRIHDKPDADRLVNLQNVVKILGLDVKIPTSTDPKQFADAIKKIKESRFDDFMKIMMLRTMAKAIYGDHNIGHFGLASSHYTHFTSPIRRYPDLMVHRMIRKYFFEGKLNLTSHFAEILPTISEHSSNMEQRAVELERKVADIKKAEFFERYIGQKFEGQIVSMLKFGFFVEFPNKVDGLIHVSSLLDGKYDLKANGFELSNGKRTFKVGDTIEVVVAKVDKSEGKIDLCLPEFYEILKSQSSRKA